MNVMTKLDLLNKDARQRLQQYIEPDMTSLLADDMSHNQQLVPFHKLNHALATLVPTISSIIPLLHSITPSLHWYVSSAQSYPCYTQSRPHYAGTCHQLNHTLVTLNHALATLVRVISSIIPLLHWHTLSACSLTHGCQAPLFTTY